MSPEQKAAYVFSQAVCALIKAMGMHAENQANLKANGEIVYGEKEFDKIVNDYGIHHNAVHDYTHS